MGRRLRGLEGGGVGVARLRATAVEMNAAMPSGDGVGEAPTSGEGVAEGTALAGWARMGVAGVAELACGRGVKVAVGAWVAEGESVADISVVAEGVADGAAIVAESVTEAAGLGAAVGAFVVVAFVVCVTPG